MLLQKWYFVPFWNLLSTKKKKKLNRAPAPALTTQLSRRPPQVVANEPPNIGKHPLTKEKLPRQNPTQIHSKSNPNQISRHGIRWGPNGMEMTIASADDELHHL